MSLALGIGASTAIFGLLDLLLLKPLPVREPQQLVHVTTAGERGPAGSGSSNTPWFQQVASRTDLFSDVMLARHDAYKVAINGRVEVLMGQRVTTNYYTLLGIPAVLGRTFATMDRPESGGSPVAVISHRLWQRRFAGRTDVLGAPISVDQRSYTIIGVTPPQFSGILVGWTMDVTLPLDTSEFMDAGNWMTMPMIARLQPGVDRGQASAQLQPMLRATATGTTERFRRRYLESVVVQPAAQGISDLRQPFGRPLRLLMAAVALLLLIACVNLAGLLAARNAARHHELGMRLALGASRFRIVRQLLTESALLAVSRRRIRTVPRHQRRQLPARADAPLLWTAVAVALRRLACADVRGGCDVRDDGAVRTPARVAGLEAWSRRGDQPRQPAHGHRPGRDRPDAGGRTVRALTGPDRWRAAVRPHAAQSLDASMSALIASTWSSSVSIPQGTGYEGDRLRVFQRDMLSMLVGTARRQGGIAGDRVAVQRQCRRQAARPCRSRALGTPRMASFR